MEHSKGIAPAICLQIKEHLRHGFIESVTNTNEHKGILRYIPHLPVFKDSITIRLTIVFFASDKISHESSSLNECLHPCPNLLQELSEIQLKYRVHQIPLVADKEKAFLQIEIDNEDRDATRLLRLKDITKSANNSENIAIYLLSFTSIPSTEQAKEKHQGPL